MQKNPLLKSFKIIMMAMVVNFLIVALGFSEIKVYDANNQYLGVYTGNVSIGEGVIDIFLPSLGYSVAFLAHDPAGPTILPESISFESEDCTGSGYLSFYSIFPRIISCYLCEDRFFATVPNSVKTFIPKSRIGNNCQCEQVSDEYAWERTGSEVSEFPESSFPFTMPFALPLKLQYSAGGDINGDSKIGLEEAVNALQIVSGIRGE